LDETTLWDALRTCYDPEIPVNIVDLGLIYTCQASPLETGGSLVKVTMTLTAPGCGMGQVLKDDVERKLSGVPGVKQVEVELVFQPPWESSMMTESARLQLGMM
jgi:probable FeS assembly SUF system protein SufT